MTENFDSVFFIIGQIGGSGIAFIILFMIVEYIPPLDRFPKVKYLIPTVLGTLFAITAVLGATTYRESALASGVIAIVIGIWYAAGSIHHACHRPLETELIKKVKENNLEGAKKILDAGADINEQDSKGATALIYAVLSTDEKLVKFLVDRGAYTRIKTDKKITARSIAIKSNLTEIIKIFDSIGQADTGDSDDKGQGDSDAARVRDVLAGKMTGSQIEEAQIILKKKGGGDMQINVFKKIAIVSILASLIYVPTQLCGRYCRKDDWTFILNLSGRQTVDWGILFIQIVVVLIVLYGIYHIKFEGR